jgi:hypothetical protein
MKPIQPFRLMGFLLQEPCERKNEKQKLPFWLSGCREYTAVCSHPRGPNAGSLWAILWIGTCDNNPKFPGSEDPGYNSLLRVLRRSWWL